MSLSPHQVLSRLAEQDREKAQEELASLSAQRKLLLENKDMIHAAMQQLTVQRAQVLEAGTEASTLMMMEASMYEKQSSLLQIANEMRLLSESEEVLMKRWLEANQKHDSHHKMQETLNKKQEKIHERRVQKQMDDIFAAKYVRDGSDL